MANSPSDKAFFVVGIGSSAGGLSALESFFSHLPNSVNAAFVVVQHLSPHHQSHMAELLQRHTALSVRFIEDGVTIAPNTVYIMPPRKMLVIKAERLRLMEQANTFSYPIDRFFESLAMAWQDRAMGIILSGTGSDGTKGLEAISRGGGIALVQSPETAEFAGMPSHAIPSGMVDEILSPADLAETICDLIYLAETHAQEHQQEEQLIDAYHLERILDILKTDANVDFSHYKLSTISRRIAHRCVLTRSPNLEQYVQQLRQSDEEKIRLRQDLLIGVTQFFRDLAAWQFLRTDVLPPILAQFQSGEQLRIWVAACATGEEAYSVAMLVDEAITHARKSIHVKIFATDLDSAALEVASRGIYDTSIAEHISGDRLERYFNRHEHHYQVKKFLRELVIFAPHNLARNAGFSRMHLICCRNVLIYMQPQLQQQVIRRLHFSLLPQGFLFLGNSEILGELEDEFTVIHRKWKIFQKRRNIPILPTSIEMPPTLPPTASLPHRTLQRSVVDRMLGDIFAFCFGDRPITCLLINQDNQLLQVLYNRAQVLDFPIGQAQMDITELMLPELQLPLSIAIHRARRDQQSVLYPNIKLNRGDREENITLRVGCHPNTPGISNVLIIFLEVDRSTVPYSEIDPEINPETGSEIDPEADAPSNLRLTGDLSSNIAQHVTELEYELQHTRDNLQATIEELESSNEEQQATNEELLAAIEELQSTNEELQSVNEELYTVNAEYEAKIQELTQLTNDIDNLLRSTNIGVIFLDRHLNIRKFTPAATQIIHLTAADVQRPIAHFAYDLNINLLDLLHQVLETEQTIEQEVYNQGTGDYLLMRLYPYRRENQEFDGIVVTFVKINDLKYAQIELQNRTDELEHLYATVPVGLGVFDENLRCLRANRVLARMDGYDSETQHVGKSVSELVPHLADRVIPYYQSVLDTGQPILNIKVHQDNPDGSNSWLVSYHPMRLLNGQRAVGITVIDISDLQRTQATLQLQENFIQRIAESLPGILFTYDLRQQQVNYLNQSITAFLGYTPETVQQLGAEVIARLVHPEDVLRVESYFQQFREAEERLVADCEYRVRHQDGSWRWLSVRGTVFQRSPTGEPEDVLAIALDISDRKQVEAQLAQSHALREAIFNESADAIFLVNAATRLSFDCNQRAVEMFEANAKTELLHIEGNVLQRQPFTPEELAMIRQEVQDTGSCHREVEYQTRQGNYFWGDLLVKQIEVATQPIYLVRVVDISDRKQVEMGMVQNMEELQRLNLVKDDFLSTVSHELRTPLTNIDMASRMLRLRLTEQGLLNQEHEVNAQHIARYLDILADQCKQERELIEDLLDL